MNCSIRYDEIDILKGIAIFFVLLGHAIIWFPINLHNINWCNTLFKFVCLVHMPLFFIVSGFCYKSIEKYDFAKYIFKKIKRLVIPYLVFNLIDIFPRAFLPQIINRPMSLSDSMHKIIFMGGEFWFLYTLFSIFLIFPLIQKCTQGNKRMQVIFFLIFLFLSLYTFEPMVFRLNSLLHYLFYFYFGYLIKLHFKAITEFYQQKIKKFPWWNYTILFTIWFFVSTLDSSKINFLGCFSGLVFLIFLVIEYKNKLFDLIKPIGQVSLQLYLLNALLLLLSRTIAVGVFHFQDALLIIGFNMIITLFLSYFIITKIFMKFKLSKILTGII